MLRSWSVLVTALLSARISQANKGYLVVSPSVMRAGVDEVVSVTILHPSTPVHVSATLFNKVGQVVAEGAQDISGKGTVKLKIPVAASGRATLKICGNCGTMHSGKFTFHNSTSIFIEEKGTMLFLQTDRPIYTPGQRVLINIFLTDPDLKPVNRSILLYVLDTRQTRVLQWDSLKPTCCGILNVSFPISDQPRLGVWTIFARLEGHLYNRTILIQKHAPPKFEVLIEPPRYISDWRTCHKVHVTARYVYRRPVKGNLTLSVTVTGIGYYKDYSSLTAASVMEINGETSFSVCMSEMIGLEMAQYFRGVLNVTATVTTRDGSNVQVVDTSCIVDRQEIHLEFPSDMRKYFRPGLPFTGELLLFHPDGSVVDGANVTVQIRAESTGIKFFKKLQSTNNGHISLIIPSIPSRLHNFWLEVQVFYINGEFVGYDYLPVYLSVNSWYSPSSCHVMVQSDTRQFQVGDTARFRVHSNCAHDGNLFYEVIARGNIVLSGVHKPHTRHTRDTNIKVIFEGEKANIGRNTSIFDIRTTTISFQVTHQMASASKLLVYYVRHSGEGVADVLTFHVKPELQNKISLDIKKNTSHPGDKVKVHVHTRSDSCFCIGAVDRNALIAKPHTTLSVEEIFDELSTFNAKSKQPEASVWPDWRFGPRRRMSRRKRSGFWRRMSRRKRSGFWWRVDKSKDSHSAFEESGLLVMTDTVGLHYGQEAFIFDSPYPYRPRKYMGFGLSSPSRQDVIDLNTSQHRGRTYFPATWIWTCFDLSKKNAAGYINAKLPDTITTWRLFGVSMSRSNGIALSRSIDLTAMKNFFVDLKIPHVVIRGEGVLIHVTIHNYQPICAKVNVRVILPHGIKIMSQADAHYNICVGKEDTATFKTTLLFNATGTASIRVEARAFSDGSCCGEMSSAPTSRPDLIGFDNVTRSIVIQSEGITQSITNSLYFCLDERVQILTSDKYEFRYVSLPVSSKTLNISVKATKDVHIALSDKPRDNPDMYEVVLGGFTNTLSWISYGKQGVRLVHAETPGILSRGEYNNFSLTWSSNVIQISSLDAGGEVILEGSVNRSLNFRYIGLSTGYGTEGEFLIWKKEDDSTNVRKGELLSVDLPADYIRGTESATVSIIGDLIGPPLHGLDRFVDLPTGCGEQNMVHFAPLVYTFVYQKNTVQAPSSDYHKHQEKLLEGYQRQLTYKRSDGSYSAFGAKDYAGSMWLTAFVLKSFAEARSFIYIDRRELDWCREWILAQQKRTGVFPPVGRLINRNLQSGAYSDISLTAYVLTAFIEAGPGSTAERRAIALGLTYLEQHVYTLDDAYPLAITAYALSLLGSNHVTSALNRLNNIAIRKGDTIHWNVKSDTGENQLFYDQSARFSKVTPGDIEAAGYVLLAYAQLGDVVSALPVVRWLTEQRNERGGFLSTQDTCVALQGLAKYALLAFTGHTDLQISLSTSKFDLQQTVRVDNINKAVSQSVSIPSLPTKLFVHADGEGCALLQVNIRFNVHTPKPSSRKYYHVKVGLTRHALSHRIAKSQSDGQDIGTAADKVQIQTCARYASIGTSNMAIMEVSLLTGFAADDVSLRDMMARPHVKVKRYEIDGRKVILYFDEIPSDCMTCVSFSAIQEFVVEKPRPVPVTVYDYYQPSFAGSVFYDVSDIRAQPRCQGDECNRIHDDVLAWSGDVVSHGNGCNSLHGCGNTAADLQKCTCFRICPPDGPRVCGSDDVIYPNSCVLEVEACQRNAYIEIKPLQHCTQDSTESWSGDGSGESFSGELFPGTTADEGWDYDVMETESVIGGDSRHAAEAANAPDDYDYLYVGPKTGLTTKNLQDPDAHEQTVWFDSHNDRLLTRSSDSDSPGKNDFIDVSYGIHEINVTSDRSGAEQLLETSEYIMRETAMSKNLNVSDSYIAANQTVNVNGSAENSSRGVLSLNQTRNYSSETSHTTETPVKYFTSKKDAQNVPEEELVNSIHNPADTEKDMADISKKKLSMPNTENESIVKDYLKLDKTSLKKQSAEIDTGQDRTSTELKRKPSRNNSLDVDNS